MSKEDFYHSDGDAYQAGFHDALMDCKLKYSNVMPMWDGWYFMRSKSNKKDVRVIYVFPQNKVMHVGLSELSKNAKTQTLRQFLRDSHDDYEWAGPIDDPDDPDEAD